MITPQYTIQSSFPTATQYRIILNLICKDNLTSFAQTQNCSLIQSTLQFEHSGNTQYKVAAILGKIMRFVHNEYLIQMYIHTYIT
jgi:hypothetical protein